MESLKELLPKRKTFLTPPKYQWQEQALEIIDKLHDGGNFRSSIFKACKTNTHLAQRAFNDCKELDKLHAKYFLKIISKKV